ncbi:hypothetical protein I6I07_19265 [Achromobacter deleyi]|uniref:Uncharacterized protein n=1 Tax=Achromobacter deleyi TaxID=1353891 RepID=A0A7T4AZ95_9BURK|nr:hypothetical protein [Achromobacter deleyi]QQB32787.1 hypothetical protein I6I07_19265 [Achromobacter deleyi]
MSQLALFHPSAATPDLPADPYAFDHNLVGGALRPFVRFCKERLLAPEGEISLSLILENAWKNGRDHPYLKAWDTYCTRHALSGDQQK